MKVVIKKVGEAPFVSELYSLKDMQIVVDGYIETFQLPDTDKVPMNICGVCNEEGLIKELPLNFCIPNKYTGTVPIHGNAFFIGLGSEDFTGLTDEQCNYIMNRFVNFYIA